jgi:uncharacterized RDD family membrane protein YckC
MAISLRHDSEVEYAGLPLRLAAFALDGLIIVIYAALLAAAALLIGGLAGIRFDGSMDPVAGNVIAFVTLVLPVVLYSTLTESSRFQATWGKRRLGLRVVGADGGRLGRSQALVRAAGKFLPWQVAHTSLFGIPGWPLAPAAPPPWVGVGFGLTWLLVLVYLGTLAFAPRHRTAYDWVAGSSVIRARSTPTEQSGD